MCSCACVIMLTFGVYLNPKDQLKSVAGKEIGRKFYPGLRPSNCWDVGPDGLLCVCDHKQISYTSGMQLW